MLVDVRGLTGKTITLSITGFDNTPPTLTIETPPANLVTNANTVTVTGTSQDREETQVKVNGVVATMSGTPRTHFSVTVPLNQGANTLAIRATDHAGNHTDSTRTVTRDTQVPTLTVTSPADGSYTNQNTVTVAGTVTDASTVTVKVNGVSFPVGQGGAFSGSYTLADGANFITIAATDAGGNVTSQVRKVTQAKQPPVLTITAPTPLFVRNTTPLPVSGTVTGTTPITVSVNGVAMTVSGSSFSGNIPLTEGQNELTFTARDPAGNQTIGHRSGKLDTHPPVLTLTGPTDASFSNATTATVTGTATDATALTVTVNGTAVTLNANGSFSQSVTLTPGANQITVTATDAATNATTALRTVTQDRTPPSLSVSAPVDGSYSNATSITVSGIATDASALTLTVNGAPVTPGANGAFSYPVALSAGVNTVTITATDAATNATTVARTITQDRDPPVVSVSTPNGVGVTTPYTNADALAVTVTVTDASVTTVSLNGVPLTPSGSGTFSGSVQLTEGVNDIPLSVTDAANNSDSRVLHVVRDTQAPTINVTSPAEGAHLTTEPVTVSGSVQEAASGATTRLTINGAGVPLDPSTLTFSSDVHLATGSNAITLVATDGAGNTNTVTRTVTFGGVIEGVPPDPATIAPRLDQTVATTTFAATSFLYTGASPIQTGVVAGTIGRLRSAEVRGTVRTRAGTALPGVKITVLDHPELGQTLSRADGVFDLVVNGGSLLTVNYAKEGYLAAQRQSVVQWQDYVRLDTVTLITLDPQSTVVDFSQAAQAAQGSLVTDEFGTRHATMVFKGGTHASLVMPDGTTLPADSLTVRATEYTVGPTGPSAMPGPLPAPSAYTYAVELSADEAIAAGATEVLFDHPVPVYVDNFLNFPTGLGVPIGTYDRVKAMWIATQDGRVIKILDVANGQAVLDIEGSGTAASSDALSALGIDDAELSTLAQLYQAGKTIWRFQVTHFSPKDANQPFQNPDGAAAPTTDDPDASKPSGGDNCEKGSIIGCERQTLGERLAVAGTTLTLNYQSDGARGYRENYKTDISLGKDPLPPNVLRIDVEVKIAGIVVGQSFPANPNQVLHFMWGGNDVFGRPVQGQQQATIRIGYVYRPVYLKPAVESGVFTFGAYGTTPISVDKARGETTIWQERKVMLGSRGIPASTIGGWTLGVHHSYDPQARVLYLGDGSISKGGEMPAMATTVVGGDCVGNPNLGQCSNIPQPGARASDIHLRAGGMARASDGTIYFSDVESFKIWRVNLAGTLELVAGNGSTDFNGDGIPATSAGMFPAQLHLGPDNSIYFLDFTGDGRIRRVDKNGIVTTAAGNGVCGDSVTTGIPANQTDLCIYDFTVAKDGTLYILDYTEVYRVGADGIITRVVGDGSYATCDAGGPSYLCAEGKSANAHAVFNTITGIAVGPDGSLYLANGEVNATVIIYRIGPDGIIRRVAGNGNRFIRFDDLGNGRAATDAVINSFFVTPAIGPDGTLYFVSNNGYLNHVDQKGVLRILAGCVPLPAPVNCVSKGGQRATLTILSGPNALDFGPDGRIYLLDDFIRRIDAPLPALSLDNILIASGDGSELYVFNADGRHLRTLNALLGNTIYEFAYDAAGLLSTVTDLNGNVIQVERDGTGEPTAIVAPFGQRTAFTLNSDNYLASVTRQGEPPTTLTYTADGLLKTFTDRNGNLHQFTFDGDGLLMRDDDPAGGSKSLVRTVSDSSSAVTVTTALGRAIAYSTTHLSTGGTRRITVDSVGLASTELNEINGTSTRSAANGMVSTISTVADPRFGMQSPGLNQVTTKTPAGLMSTVTEGESTVLADAANPLSLVSKLDSSVVNGQVFRRTYLAATQTFTETTPLGRQTTHRMDASGRLIEQGMPEITPIQYQYEAAGRLAQVAQGSRRWTYTYDAQGHLATTTDPLTRTGQYFYDGADRLTRRVLTDGRELMYSYDGTGNLRSIAQSGRPAQQFQFNSVNFLSSYEPPSLGAGVWSTAYQYNADRKLTQITRPDGLAIEFGYDAAGRRRTISVPAGAVNYTYDPATGNVSGVSGPYGGTLAFTYDGALLTGVTLAGEVAGTISATYNNGFRTTGISVNGGPAVNFAYDADGLLRQAGDLTIDRNPSNGLLTGTALGSVTTSQSYTPLGELARYTASMSNTALFDVTYIRDAVGRISELTESVGGAITTKAYTYDPAGRLTDARENGTLAAVYEYDAYGHRSRVTRPSGVEAETYDDQDRLLTHGMATYTYTRNGELSTKTVGNAVTHYDYDVLGNLRGVTLPDGTAIQYVVDGLNRRVGKKVNGVLVQGFLFQTQLNPIAELDGTGNVVSRFIYGTKRNIPDYMLKNGVPYRLITDQLGSVRLVVDVTTGAVVQRIDYDAWGTVTQNTNPDFQPFGFAGGHFDRATGLLRYGVRDYDPETGRWTAKDPIGLAGGGLNLYTYVLHDPVNLTDPYGECPPERNACDDAAHEVLVQTVITAGEIALFGLGGAVGGVARVVEGEQLATEGRVIERAASRETAGAIRRASAYERASEIDAKAAGEIGHGFAETGASVGVAIREGGRAFLDDTPWWYDALKMIPVPGVGMLFAIGEEINICLFQ
jgi:RHS repeat-associated protein